MLVPVYHYSQFYSDKLVEYVQQHANLVLVNITVNP
jgi:hypothetical protein